jgi:hypothetical protein
MFSTTCCFDSTSHAADDGAGRPGDDDPLHDALDVHAGGLQDGC